MNFKELNKQNERANDLLQKVIEIAKDNIYVTYEMTTYELHTLQSALLQLKALLGE